MNNWDIRKQILALALLPILMVSIVLTSYFTLAQLDFISESEIKHGNIITQQLGPISEYAVFSGNVESLKPILNNIQSNVDIISIKITNSDNETLISTSDKNRSQISKSLWHRFASNELTVFKEPIKTTTMSVSPFNNQDNLPDKQEEIIGYIELTFTSLNINAKKIQTAAKGGLLTLVILIASMIVALRLSRKISKPVQTLTNTVKKISSGDYKIRINDQSPGDLGVLESCVNIMTEELQSSHSYLNAQIDESTRELQETMEELEIRNAELDISRSKAIQASKAKTEFLADMSHELRTPLGGILGFTELLENTNLESQQRDYAEIIKKSAHNLLYIIDDVLDLSKIESGKLEINNSEFNIVDIVEEVIDLLIPIAYEKSLELFYYIDKGTPNIINSDPNRAKQILINLIGNAIKFTEKGFVSLHIGSHQEDNLSTQLIFSVTDTGIGMNQLQRDRLFNAFTQADKTIERKFGGTGLGLVISKKLAQLLQGDIDFKSQYNRGSTFTLRISAECKQQEYNPDPSFLNKHICLVDQQKTCCTAVQNMLDLWGCKTDTYTQIPTELSSYDLAIINICSSCMNDEAIRSFIPKNKSTTPLLAIVSTRSHKKLNDIKNYGFNDAVFHSAKHVFIKQSASKLINPDIKSAEMEQPANKALFEWSGLNVLVVDDNDINLKLAEIILTKNGAQVVTAESGQQAIDLTKNHHFDLIFMDLQMPDMDGYESSIHIRENKNNDDTIIIALTANAMASKESRKFEQCEINDVLIKPVNETSIQNTIDKWLKNKINRKQQIDADHEIELFSKSEALKLAAGNIQLANELTGMLINELPSYLQIITEALASQNIEQLRQQAHKLHGAARCCGTLTLRHAAERLESDIDNNISNNLEPNTQLLLKEIEKLINTDQSTLMI